MVKIQGLVIFLRACTWTIIVGSKMTLALKSTKAPSGEEPYDMPSRLEMALAAMLKLPSLPILHLTQRL